MQWPARLPRTISGQETGKAYEFDGDLLVGEQVGALEDDTKGAFTDLLADAIVHAHHVGGGGGHGGREVLLDGGRARSKKVDGLKIVRSGQEAGWPMDCWQGLSWSGARKADGLFGCVAARTGGQGPGVGRIRRRATDDKVEAGSERHRSQRNERG